MKFGCCLSLDAVSENGLVEGLMRRGFDYIELPARVTADLDAAAYAKLRGRISSLGVDVPAMNVFLPDRVRVTGDDADARRLREYAEACFERGAQIGCRLVVFGSAGARNLAGGFPAQTAKTQMTEALALLAGLAEPYGIRIALEPLGKGECNFINTLAEGLELVRAAGRANVGLAADFFHMSVNAEPAEEALAACGEAVFHTHFADPDGRVYPTVLKPGFRPFFAGLKKIGYDGLLSIEAGTSDMLADAARSIEVLRQLA